MKHALRSVIFIVGTLGWWGFVYPDLCLTPEECAADSGTDVVWEYGPEEAGWEDEAESESAIEAEEIRIKSRLYEYVCQVREKG